MRRLAPVLAALALAASARAAGAQNTCNLIRQEGNWTSIGDPKARVISAQGPLLVHCSNGEDLRADSAVIYQAQNEVYLYRQVDYEDPTRSLTSDQATYNSQTGRLYATGNVVFTDKQQGSTLRGPELEYFRAMAGRPQSQMTATQRPHVTVRPKSSSSAGAENRRREPMEIDADRVTSLGDRYMTATGNVVINDNGTRSTTDEAYYDQVADHVELRRNAKVDNDRYHLTGDFIASDLKNGSLSKVVAQNHATLVSERLTVTGPQLQLFFERDLLQRMVSGQVTGSGQAAQPPPAAPPTAPTPATAPPAAPPAPIAPRPSAPPPPTSQPPSGSGRTQQPASSIANATTAGQAAPASGGTLEAPHSSLPAESRSVAVSKGFRMEGDSLEAILTDQKLRQVIAVGAARGESWDTIPVRTVRVDSGGAAGRVPAPPRSMTEPPTELDQKDVLIADTIIAFFKTDSVRPDSLRPRGARGDSVRLAGRPVTPPRPAGPVRRDSAQAQGDTAKTEIERLLAIGDAHSLYRMRNDSAKAGLQRPGLNYLIGDRIDLTFKDGEVDVAHVRGLKQGVYLDPDNGTRTDSTAAGRDTSRAGRAAAGAGARAGPGTTARPATSTQPRGGTAPSNRPAPTAPAPPSPRPPSGSGGEMEDEDGAAPAGPNAPPGGLRP